MPLAEALALANALNETLHRAKIAKEARAAWLATVLLAIESKRPLDEHPDDASFIEALQAPIREFFEQLGAEELWSQVAPRPRREALPRTAAALRELLQSVREHRLLEQARLGDLLGAFFEAFLRYGNTGRELGIALTPAHLCRLAVRALEVDGDDHVYDPAAGTGGFLAAACEGRAKRRLPQLRGAEVSPHVAALAAINLHLRGADPKGIEFGSCFAAPSEATATRVLMNPPFSLKHTSEAESDFIDLALGQLAPEGLLFAVLPASVMYDAKNQQWRSSLLAAHTLLSVMLLPPDLFYPVATECVAIVLRAGSPHPDALPVLWARIRDDGFVKRKGFRVEREDGAADRALAPLTRVLADWAVRGQMGTAREGEYEFRPIRSRELLPQAHLGTPRLDPLAFAAATREAYRAIVMQRWQQTHRSDAQEQG